MSVSNETPFRQRPRSGTDRRAVESWCSDTHRCRCEVMDIYLASAASVGNVLGLCCESQARHLHSFCTQEARSLISTSPHTLSHPCHSFLSSFPSRCLSFGSVQQQPHLIVCPFLCVLLVFSFFLSGFSLFSGLIEKAHIVSTQSLGSSSNWFHLAQTTALGQQHPVEQVRGIKSHRRRYLFPLFPFTIFIIVITATSCEANLCRFNHTNSHSRGRLLSFYSLQFFLLSFIVVYEKHSSIIIAFFFGFHFFSSPSSRFQSINNFALPSTNGAVAEKYFAGQLGNR